VTNQERAKVMKLRASDGAVLESVTVGTLPMQVAFDVADTWVTNARSATVPTLEK